jgi:hypothetical protein
VADVAFLFENAQHRPDGGIAWRIRQRRLHLGSRGAALRIKNVNDLPLAAAEIEVRLTHYQWLLHANLDGGPRRKVLKK